VTAVHPALTQDLSAFSKRCIRAESFLAFANIVKKIVFAFRARFGALGARFSAFWFFDFFQSVT
jgi:hypothetical protein